MRGTLSQVRHVIEGSAMTVSAGCKGCGRLLRIKEQLAGRRIKCPHCRIPQLVDNLDTLESLSRSPAELATPPRPWPVGVRWVLRIAAALLIGMCCVPGLYIAVGTKAGNPPASQGTGPSAGAVIGMVLTLFTTVPIALLSTLCVFASDETVLSWADKIGTKNLIAARIVCLLCAMLTWGFSMMILAAAVFSGR